MSRFLMLQAAVLTTFGSFAAQKEEIRVQPVSRTPEAGTIAVIVAVPKNGAVVSGNRVWIQTRVDGFPLGAGSQFDRRNEVVNSKMGQTLHVIIDNEPYFAINEPALDPFNEEGWYYDTNYKFQVPNKLADGEHVVRLFPARSYGESLKGEQTFSVTTFYVNSKPSSRKYDLSKPYLTYNEPSPETTYFTTKPILLDFYISNCELTTDGYKVRLIIDGKTIQDLTSWQPYYLYGLSSGKHTIRLELINGSGAVVKGPFSEVERIITVR